MVLARTGDAPGAVDLFLVPTAAAGVSATQKTTIGSDAQFDVTFTDVAVSDADRIGAAGSGWAGWDAVMHDGIILLAAQAMGGARQALDITVQYAKDRQQFDKPLGAFQALAHYLADAQTTVDGGTTLVHEAAWARSAGRSVEKLAPMAKLFACQTYRDVTAMAQQVFGGIGFTLEFDIQLYFRRAKQLQISWWDTRYLEELVAVAVLDDLNRASSRPGPKKTSIRRLPGLRSGPRPGRAAVRQSGGSGMAADDGDDDQSGQVRARSALPVPVPPRDRRVPGQRQADRPIWRWRCWPPSSSTTRTSPRPGSPRRSCSYYHMSFAFYVGIVVVSNLIGAFASLPASEDRPARPVQRGHLRPPARRAAGGRRGAERPHRVGVRRR